MATTVIKGSALNSTQSLAGNGVDKHAALDSPPWQSDTQGSVSVWFKLTALPVSNGPAAVIYAASDGTAGSARPVFLLCINNVSGNVRLRIISRLTDGGAGLERIGTTLLTTGVWYHAVFTGNSTSSRIYLNGVEEAYTVTTLTTGWWGNLTYVGTRRHAMYARWLNGAYGLHFPGRIASLGVWSYALSAVEVAEAYRGGRAANLSKLSFTNVLSLLAWYRPGTEMTLPTLRDWYQGQHMTTTNFVGGDIVTDHPPL